MSTCPTNKFNLTDAVNIVKDLDGEFVMVIVDSDILSTIKRYLATLDLEFSKIAQSADFFVLFKLPEGGILSEFINHCTGKYLGMDEIAYRYLVNLIGIPL